MAADRHKDRNLPTARAETPVAGRRPTPLSTVAGRTTVGAGTPQGLPNASIVYGIAAALLAVIAVFFIMGGRWFTGLVVLFPALCFLGYAIHFIRAPRA